MTYTLSNLRGLYKAMKDAGITRYKWRFTRGPATFEAIFIFEEEPFELLLGALGTNFGTTLRILPGFRVDTQLNPEDYRALCAALQLTFTPDRPFRPADFFSDLNNSIPQTVNLSTGRVQPQDVLAYRRNVPDSAKRFFCGWEDNTKDGGNVSEHNLAKTREAFGERVYEFCRKYNISSKWTDDPDRAQDFCNPWGN